MKQDLDALKSEIEGYLKSSDFVVFHGFCRTPESAAAAHWDVERNPDFRAFLETARRAGARLVVYTHREFTTRHLDDAIERLEAADLPRDERRGLEKRLRDLRPYEGFTCSLELAFDSEGRCFTYDVRTDWYEDLLDILDEIDALVPEEGEDEEGAIGGYFSRN